ncbi:MAG TPA: hypothetical protein VKB02_06935 [Pyrinomonadaceae bacterium]|nr:hypothetical protein [Pyrinomonadaceae bacterium]
MNKGGPTQEDFAKLLRWLDPDRDKAGEQYEKIRLRLVRIFSSRGCCEADELADQSINVVISKIDWLTENYVGNPALYFYAVAKKIYLGSRKPKPLPVVPPPDPHSPEVEQLSVYLDECLDELTRAERDLVLQYHECEKQEKIRNRKRLAEELKISRNALRIKVCHIHSRLKKCIDLRLRASLG